MRSKLLEQGSSIAVISLVSITLAACTGDHPGRPQSLLSGSGGQVWTTGVAGASSTPPDAGVPPFNVGGAGGAIGTDGGTQCVNGVAVNPGLMTPPGIPPQLPATPTQAATPVPPLTGGTLLTTSDGRTAVASDPDRDQVYFVDLVTNTLRATTALMPGDEPGRLVEDGAARIHVALRRGGAVVTLDPTTGAIIERRSVCGAPRGLAYQQATDQIHVACAGGELITLPPAGGAPSRTLTLDRDLRDVVVGKEGTLLVSTFRRAEVLVVAADGTIASRLGPGSGAVHNLNGQLQTRTPSVAWRMVPYDTTTGSVVMLHQTGMTDVIDPVTQGYGGIKGCGGIVQAGVTVVTPGGATPPVSGGINMVSLAVDVAVSPDGKRIALAVPGNAETQGFPTVMEGTVEAAQAETPCGGGLGGVGNVPSGEVISVAYSTSGVLLAQLRNPAVLWRADTNATVSLSDISRTDTGHMIFHVNAGGGLACASCHPEGGEDGRVWNFVCAGARRTQSIRGGISPTAPFHWDGTEHDFSSLMDDVFSHRMAGPMLNASQKTALQQWVDTIPLLPANSGLDAAAVARGQTLFNDPKVACATCHMGALLTNNATVDVGTGQALQVPSLRGVSWRGPFMHNGCAATLADRFSGAATCTGGDKHGVTSMLTPAQIGDLTAYLQSL
jgi:mono/diheme cytochrome c family protein